MNNGKNFEKLVRLIQETLKDIPDTEIFSNFKIKNNGGKDSEIDILIKASINNLEIMIAIECKDYKKPVPVALIDAFNSKCQRIKGISKKVFVSSNGYQASVYDAASQFEVDLYNLSEISKDSISKWFPITQLKPNIVIQLPFKIHVSGGDNDIETFQKDRRIVVHFFEERESIFLDELLWMNIIERQNEIKNHMLLDFIKRRDKEKSKIETRMPFSIECEGIYVLNEIGIKLKVSKVESEVIGWFNEVPANIIEARNYYQKDSIPKAQVVTLDVGKEEVANVIFSNKNDLSIFHTKKDGQIYKMKTFLTYDPKTDKFTFDD